MKARRSFHRSSGTIVVLTLLIRPLLAWGAEGESHFGSAAVRHWAFQVLASPKVPPAIPGWVARTPVDRFVQARLAKEGIRPGRPASKETLIRRVAFVLTGLPAEPVEVQAYLRDRSVGADERMVGRYLESPRYAERWAKHWLDASGYADSNGYFSADTDRPLAYRYRDYVIRSFNRDKPFDVFVREQLAGDELAGWRPGQPVSPGVIELLEATHYLRNGQDGSGESDGNPDEVRTDRYYALESSMQIIGSSLLGLTVQCAKCHDHKFEPLTQKDYYAFQAFLYPAFDIDKWTKPNDRVVEAPLPGELEKWRVHEQALDVEQAVLKQEMTTWVVAHRPAGRVVFEDKFEVPDAFERRWSNTAPGDDVAGGQPPVKIGGDEAPAARIRNGTLEIVEGGGSGDRWISSRDSFDWRPAKSNDWIQATFDVIATKVDEKGKAAERIGWLIALHDFNDNSAIPGGNILVDGNPGGATSVHVDYPGADSSGRGTIGAMGYSAGHNYGVRITRSGEDQFLMEHLVDGVPDGATSKLKAEDLPAGGIGFEYCCGRSYVVDNVRIEVSQHDDAAWTAKFAVFSQALAGRKKEFDARNKALAARRFPKPGRIAWVSDAAAEPPVVRMLKRGNHKTPGAEIEPAYPAFIATSRNTSRAPVVSRTSATTGRRLAWAHWLTEPGSPQSALLARVTVNRMWQHYFGTGLVATPDNLGLSGAPPTHPELLDWLASAFVRSGWSLKALHRLLLDSAVFRQTSAPDTMALKRDPTDQLLWRYPLRRLDAESIRDAILSASGRLGTKTSGPFVPTMRSGAGEVIVEETRPDAFSRSIFLQQRRSQVPTFLGVFDAPSMVFNCSRRAETTMPLQSLSLLNSDFAMKRGEDLARRVAREAGPSDRARIHFAFQLMIGRLPDRAEYRAATGFLEGQRRLYRSTHGVEDRVWTDFCQSLFGLNAFLYLE